MPEEQSQTTMAVDELQAIIQRCVSTFLFINLTNVSSSSFSLWLQNTRHSLADLLIGQLGSVSMFHWLLHDAYPKFCLPEKEVFLFLFCLPEKEVFLFLSTVPVWGNKSPADCYRKYIFYILCCSLELENATEILLCLLW